MKLKTSLFALSGLLLAVASYSHAGLRETRTVQINTTSRTASGALGDVRNSSDANQTIGCQRNAIVGSTPAVGCRARAATGGYVGCNSNDPDLISVVGNISSDSYVNFGWDAAGVCTFITIDNDSRWAPKGP